MPTGNWAGWLLKRIGFRAEAFSETPTIPSPPDRNIPGTAVLFILCDERHFHSI